jgi:hypothetical protein
LLAPDLHAGLRRGHAGADVRVAVDAAATFPTHADAAHGPLGLPCLIDAQAAFAGDDQRRGDTVLDRNFTACERLVNNE